MPHRDARDGTTCSDGCRKLGKNVESPGRFWQWILRGRKTNHRRFIKSVTTLFRLHFLDLPIQKNGCFI